MGEQDACLCTVAWYKVGHYKWRNLTASSMAYSLYLVQNQKKQALVKAVINCLLKSGPFYSRHLKIQMPRSVWYVFCRKKTYFPFFLIFKNSMLSFQNGPRLLKKVYSKHYVLYKTFYNALFEC